jgi:pimeloyl-ACP methyl ester carboxylesterase
MSGSTMWSTLLFALLAVVQVPEPRHVSFETADGANIEADVYGQGSDAVVLAHGAVFNKESWRTTAEVLAKQGHLVLAINFRGRGTSTRGREDNALFQDVLAAVRYARAGGAATVSIVGASMGGGAAAQAAVGARPGEIDRLLLLSAVSIASPEAMQAGRFLFVASRDEAMVASVKKQFARSPEPKRLELLDGAAHAQNIFATDQGARLTALIVEFLHR